MINSVAIIGCGIAGSAAALFLTRIGVQVSVFEGSAPDADAGAGLVLQAPALAVLHAAGLAAELWQLAAPIGKIDVEFTKSKRRFTLAYESNLNACGVQRAALQRVLRSAMDAQTQHAVAWNTRITDVDAYRGLLTGVEDTSLAQAARQTCLAQATRQTSPAIGARQTTHGPFDLIIAADGVNSSVRSACKQIRCYRQPYPNGAIVCLATLPDSYRNSQTLTQRFNTGSHVSVWPVGANAPGAPHCITIALPVKADALAQLAANPSDWLMLIRKIQPELAAQLAELESLPKLVSYRYSDVVCSPYFNERIVLIGDAAHAMSPQLGLGAGLALQDAWCLAQCVQKTNLAQAHFSQALKSFDQQRRSEANRLRRISRIVTPLFQSSNPVIDFLREPTMRAFANNALMQRIALRILCHLPAEIALSGMAK